MGDLATGQDVSGFEIAPVADRQFRRESLQNRGTAVEVEDASVGKARRVGDSISLRRPVAEREGRGIGVRGVAVEEQRLARTVRPPSPFRKYQEAAVRQAQHGLATVIAGPGPHRRRLASGIDRKSNRMNY